MYRTETSMFPRDAESNTALQTVGLLSALVFVINTLYELVVVHGLYASQHFLIALLLWVLSGWALLESVKCFRKTAMALTGLTLALGAQWLVEIVRHAGHFPNPELVPESFALAGDLAIGNAAFYGPLYLAQFMLICKLLINAFSYAEILRGNQLDEQIAINRRSEDALRESEARYRLIAENSDDVIWTLNTSGRLTYVSPSALKLVGYSPDDVLKLNLHSIFSRVDLETLRDIFSHASNQLARGLAADVYRGEFELRHAEGRALWAEIAVGPMFETDGRLSGFVGVARNISERKAQADILTGAHSELASANKALQQANYELAEHQDRLEILVAGRTRELVAARAEADSANAFKTRFMANVSHEMRTPLQGILGYAEVGKVRLDDACKEEIDSYFDHILSSGNQMHSLVEGLLTLTNKSWDAHLGNAQCDTQNIDVMSFTHALGALMAQRVQARGQRIGLEVAPECPPFIGDPIRLQQVFEHLLGNASRYSGQATTIQWRVYPTRFLGNGSEIEIDGVAFDIIDQGCGVPDNELIAVFEPFYESSRTADGGGAAGLGLPLSRSIVCNLGGTISLMNRPEGGLICRVVLPSAAPSSTMMALLD